MKIEKYPCTGERIAAMKQFQAELQDRSARNQDQVHAGRRDLRASDVRNTEYELEAKVR